MISKLILITLTLLTINVFGQTENSTYKIVADKFEKSYNESDFKSIFDLFSAEMQTALPLDKTTDFLNGLKSQAGQITKRQFVKYKDDKMDIYGKEGVNAGKHFTAIYKYDNEELIICYNLQGDSYPETFETKGKPMYFLSIFKKEITK